MGLDESLGGEVVERHRVPDPGQGALPLVQAALQALPVAQQGVGDPVERICTEPAEIRPQGEQRPLPGTLGRAMALGHREGAIRLAAFCTTSPQPSIQSNENKHLRP